MRLCGRLDSTAGVRPITEGEEAEGIRDDDERAPLVEQHGEPEVQPEQRRRDEHGDHPQAHDEVLADDAPRPPAEPDGEGGFNAVVAIADFRVLRGSLRARVLRLALAWAQANKARLEDEWQRLQG